MPPLAIKALHRLRPLHETFNIHTPLPSPSPI
jgi:hypothetical protein